MKNKFYLLVVASVMMPALALRAEDINSLLSQWSVITSGDLELVNDIQGRAYVGGNVTVPNSFNAATVGSSAIAVNDVSLAVAGNIASGGNMQVNGGSVVVGGSIARTINMNSHGTVTQGNPAALPASPFNQIANASQFWSGLAANSTTSVGNNQQLNFNCAPNSSLAVFNLTASQMFAPGLQGFTLNPAAITGDILINVEGSTVNWASGGFFSQFNTAAWNGRVLFNFFDATSVTLSGQIGGYVVAPNANVVADNNIDGGVVAKTLTVDSEVDLPNNLNGASAWDGNLPNVSAPEASTAISGVGALVMLAGFVWREKKNVDQAAA